MKYLNSEEYNTLVLAVNESADFIARGRQGRTKEQFYKTLFDKLFTITEDDLLKKEEINHPISNS
jgi:CRISPR/Cas system CSM-associated protein Csm2 small subunit